MLTSTPGHLGGSQRARGVSGPSRPQKDLGCTLALPPKFMLRRRTAFVGGGVGLAALLGLVFFVRSSLHADIASVKAQLAHPPFASVSEGEGSRIPLLTRALRTPAALRQW